MLEDNETYSKTSQANRYSKYKMCAFPADSSMTGSASGKSSGCVTLNMTAGVIGMALENMIPFMHEASLRSESPPEPAVSLVYDISESRSGGEITSESRQQTESLVERCEFLCGGARIYTALLLSMSRSGAGIHSAAAFLLGRT